MRRTIWTWILQMNSLHESESWRGAFAIERAIDQQLSALGIHRPARRLSMVSESGDERNVEITFTTASLHKFQAKFNADELAAFCGGSGAMDKTLEQIQRITGLLSMHNSLHRP